MGLNYGEIIMSTYTLIIYHIIFSTKNRRRTITMDKKEELLKYIWGTIKNTNSHLYRINAVEDHIHILTSVNKTLSLSEFVKKIKISSNKWIKENNIFPNFDSWQKGYAAFTIAHNEKGTVINYIKNQEEHHKHKSFIEEYKEFLEKYKIKYDEKYL